MKLDLAGREPEIVTIETEAGWIAMDRTEQGAWSRREMQVTLAPDGEGAAVYLQSRHEAVRRIQFRWNQPILSPILVYGDHWERGYGDLEWRGLVPERILPWYFLVYDGEGTSGCGVKTGAGALCYWRMDSQYTSLTADVRCGNAGVVLGDRKLAVATIVGHEGLEGQSPFDTARSFCKKMCDKPVLPSHPVYGGNNWYYAYGNSSHARIIEDSKFMSSVSSSDLNRPYMVIDDGWQLLSRSGTGNGGPWIGNRGFPDMPALAAEMKRCGVRPGLWFRPLLTHEHVPEDWVRFTDHGHYLDPSVPEVLDFIAETTRRLSDWGYELIKHDYTSFDLFGQWGVTMRSDPCKLPFSFRDRSRTTAEIITGLYRTISDAANGSIVIGCNTVGHLSAGIVQIQRTGDDTSGKEWERTRKMGINTLAFRMPQHGTFYSHDADCVGITDHIPWELNRQWLHLLSESGTPLFVSADPVCLNNAQKKAIKAAFDRASQSLPAAEPLDWLYNTCPTYWKLGDGTVHYDWIDRLSGGAGMEDI